MSISDQYPHAVVAIEARALIHFKKVYFCSDDGSGRQISALSLVFNVGSGLGMILDTCLL